MRNAGLDARLRHPDFAPVHGPGGNGPRRVHRRRSRGHGGVSGAGPYTVRCNQSKTTSQCCCGAIGEQCSWAPVAAVSRTYSLGAVSASNI